MNWGILSCGKISNDFALALRSTARKFEHKIEACATRNNLQNAQQFAKIHNITTAYGSYAELLGNPSVEIVYIGSINTAHFENCKDALLAGKHVLCEKPMVLRAAQAEELFALAREKGCFLMEAMWSRFNPIYKQLSTVLESGEIGEVTSAFANFTTKSNTVPRIMNKEIGGGGMYDLGVYTLQLCLFAFGDRTPDEISCSGSLDPISGVDNVVNIQLVYNNRGFANSFVTTLQNSNRFAQIIGTKGSVKLHPPFHTPTKAEIFLDGKLDRTIEHKLPPSENQESKFIFGNSENLIYEADAVVECIKAGKLQCDDWTGAHTKRTLAIIESALKQIGYY